MKHSTLHNLDFVLCNEPLDRLDITCYGPVAQLGERLICIQEVSGSIPLRSSYIPITGVAED